MAGNNNDPFERTVTEYLKITEKCVRECLHITNVTDVTGMKVMCVRYCTAYEMWRLSKSVISRSQEPKKK